MTKRWSQVQYSNLALSLLLLIQQFSPILLSVSAQSSDPESVPQTEEERCLSSNAQTSCGQCIRSGRLCTWMERGVYNNTRTKCFSKGDGKKPTGSVYPSGISVSIQSNTGKLNTYIRPEESKIAIRPGFDTVLDIYFKVHKSYPVDLYYLFDLSSSMKTYLQEVMDQAIDITDKLSKEIGDNLRIGIGSFIEKPTAPFTNNGGQHVFKNWLSLTDANSRNMETIKKQIGSLRDQALANNDAEEAGLEAMVQVATCKQEIGWNDISKHIVVYSSDATMHLAGDARLAGINKPNDLQCHLKSGGKQSIDQLDKTHHEYTEGLNQDYPSVYDVKNLVNKANIQTIFALTAKNKIPDWINDFYKSITKIWGEENKVVSTNNEKLSDLLVQTYKEMTKRVTLNIEGIPEDYEWSVDTVCTGTDGVERTNKGQSYCDDPKKPLSNRPEDVKETEVNFKLNIKLKEGRCPEPARVSINTPGYGGSEKVDLKLESTCSCDGECESRYSSLRCPAKEECSGNGEFSCGVCICNKGWSGSCCDCEIGDSDQEREREAQCFVNGSDRICSGRGQCQCGKCICDKTLNNMLQFFGDHCQCTLGSCPSVGNKVCNDQGSCQCGKCICNNGWSGEDCGCSDKTDKCEKNCNNNGACGCNKCDCLKDVQGLWSFRGESCDTFQVDCNQLSVCKDGPSDECNELAREVKSIPKNREQFIDVCQMSNEGKYCPDNPNTEAKTRVQFYNDGGNLFYTRDEYANCVTKVNVAAILTWTIASTILLGLLIILVIKVIIEWLNYKEFKALVNEEKQNELNAETTGFIN